MPANPQSATELRDYADHVRQITHSFLDTETVTRLSAYAEELDARADAVEKVEHSK
jgi:hypothetical protein